MTIIPMYSAMVAVTTFIRSSSETSNSLDLLGVGREEGKIFYGAYIGIIFPYSLLSPSKSIKGFAA